MTSDQLTKHAIVSRQEWLAARKELLTKEKELTRLKDKLNQERLALPWVRLEKDYTFAGPTGLVKFSSLFGKNSQLFVQHFMFDPEWEAGCNGCSFKSDHIDGALLHLPHHDVSFVSISRAPIEKIEAFKTRMNWQFPWLSSFDSDFNYDFGVSFKGDQIVNGKVEYNYRQEDFVGEQHGSSCFYRDLEGNIYHTYSTYGRGDESLIGAYGYLDMLPLGRNENGPKYDMQDWLKHHDRYEETKAVDSSALYKNAKK